MELVSLNKLEAVADFLSDDEVFGIAPCSHFNNSLKRDRVDVSCDIGDCDGDCPFYSKENFIKWIKKPDSKYDVSNLKRPQQEDFIGYDNVSNSLLDKDGYIKALEEYCDNLEKHYKELQDALEAAGVGNGTLYKYALNAERGLRIAIGDAMPDVSEWRRFAEGYGEEKLFDKCVSKEKSYINGVAWFYSSLASKMDGVDDAS